MGLRFILIWWVVLSIFEGKNAELIRIPRLPITLDCQAIEPHKVTLALIC